MIEKGNNKTADGGNKMKTAEMKKDIITEDLYDPRIKSIGFREFRDGVGSIEVRVHPCKVGVYLSKSTPLDEPVIYWRDPKNGGRSWAKRWCKWNGAEWIYQIRTGAYGNGQIAWKDSRYDETVNRFRTCI